MHEGVTRTPNYNPYLTHNYCIFCGFVLKNNPENYRCSVCGKSARTESRNKKAKERNNKIKRIGGD